MFMVVMMLLVAACLMKASTSKFTLMVNFRPGEEEWPFLRGCYLVCACLASCTNLEV
jgi:hypothetical protein